MSNRLLPIGTVVQLQDSTARVMIAGYLAAGPQKPGYVWDYSGFKYPIGYQNEDEIYLFDQGQIEIVLGLGYQDYEQFPFIAKLEAAAEKVKSDVMIGEGAQDGPGQAQAESESGAEEERGREEDRGQEEDRPR